jgi:hypothetical protein
MGDPEVKRWIDWRGVVLTGLISAALWFVFYGQDLWRGALGLTDLPGAELYVLGLLIIVGVGVAWPEPLASVAAGVGGLSGLLIAVSVTDRFEDFFPPGTGFDATWFQLLVTPAGAHAIGAAFAQVIRRPGPTEPDLSVPMP